MTQYQAMHAEYVQILQNRVGIRFVSSETMIVRNARGRVILYIVGEFEPMTLRDYYGQDTLTWRVCLVFGQIDRALLFLNDL